jgi:2-polyprenyl-3-methyl-5-hydroxy-6-metoxy-1,4-benzoquinol methylase
MQAVTAQPATETLDPEKTALFALKVWSYKQGEIVSLMVHLGDRLGLYRAMAGAGPLSAGQLAARTHLHERWVLEWLRSQADEETSLWFAAGAFQGAAVPAEVLDRLEEAFRTGVGFPYDALGPAGAHHVERMLAPWSRLALVPKILPALEGVTDRLRRGARVADVGCGAGVALIAIAEAFPESTFEGFDVSLHAIARARAKLAEAGLSNAAFYVAEAADLPSSVPYDLILTLDCIHDMPRPERAIAAIRRAIAADGTWLIKDIRSSLTWRDNLANPMLAMMYGQSVATCMSSALSEPGGAGLGTLGFNPEVAERMCRQAGFTRFLVHDFDDPANLYYEVRP